MAVVAAPAAALPVERELQEVRGRRVISALRTGMLGRFVKVMLLSDKMPRMDRVEQKKR